MLFTIFARAARNLFLPGILKLFLLCLLAYVGGWMVLTWIIAYLIAAYAGISGSEGFLLHVISGLGGTVLAWFLFPLLYPLLVNFFDDYMADVIEREDYPGLPPARPPFWPTLLEDIWFTVKAIALNVLCLPLYLIPVLGLMLYYGLNGYLLGMQFFRMMAGRRVSAAEAAEMERRGRRTILIAGAAISFCSTIPVLNLAAPLLGVAAMLHLFHALRGAEQQVIAPPWKGGVPS